MKQQAPRKRLEPAALQRLLAEAQAHDRAGRLPAAAACYEQALAAGDRNPAVMHALGLVYARGGDLARAAEVLAQAARLAPRDAALQNNLGNVLTDAGRQREALAAYEAALRLQPEHANAHFNVAHLLENASRRDEAIEHLRTVVRLRPGDDGAWNELGVLLSRRGDIDEAQACFERVMQLAPALSEPYINMGLLHMWTGDTEGARQWYERALAVDPRDVRAYANIARTRRFRAEDLPLVERIEAMLARDDIESKARSALHFAIGKMFDDIGDYDHAARHFADGNRLRRADLRFDRQVYARYTSSIIEAFPADWFARLGAAGEPSPLPVFVFGMMRSGTTLAEQIVSSHPQVLGAGELPDMLRLVERLPLLSGTRQPFPASMPGMDAARLREFGRAYLARLPAHGADITRVTDKQTYNFIYAGLIAACLPRASLVYCERNAEDVCLSIWMQSFVDGHPYAYDQQDIAFVHREHERLMAHWFEVLGDRILRVRYEAVVADIETHARRLVAHCGLDWDERCLAFQANERAVHTASNWQVRQPVYRTSVERWRRYEKHIGPMLAALQA